MLLDLRLLHTNTCPVCCDQLCLRLCWTINHSLPVSQNVLFYMQDLRLQCALLLLSTDLSPSFISALFVLSRSLLFISQYPFVQIPHISLLLYLFAFLHKFAITAHVLFGVYLQGVPYPHTQALLELLCEQLPSGVSATLNYPDIAFISTSHPLFSSSTLVSLDPVAVHSLWHW